jgi:ATP-dependent protease HslVU (ClpYQ) peptidase subunit
MTIVVAYKAPSGEIWLAADSRVSGGNDALSCRTPKICSFDGFSVGYTGSCRFGQVLLYAFRPPKHPKNIDTDEYMFTLWGESLKEYLEQYGVMATTESVDTIGGNGDAIIVYRDQLYVLQDDFSFLKPEEHFVAGGSGTSYALGVMSALSHPSLASLDLSPEFIVEQAVACAIGYCPTCGGNILKFKHDPQSNSRKIPRKPRKAIVLTPTTTLELS